MPWFKAPEKEDTVFVSGSNDDRFNLDNLNSMNVRAAIASEGGNTIIHSESDISVLMASMDMRLLKATSRMKLNLNVKIMRLALLLAPAFVAIIANMK